jgi:hypothetical protein
MPDFEASFGDFIDRREYDQAESALFSMVRIAFKAGWMSAGGNPPPARKVLELHRPARTIPLETDPGSIDTDIPIDE